MLSPKGRDFVAEFRLASLPPRCSSRETPIDSARLYPSGADGVKAVPTLLTG